MTRVIIESPYAGKSNAPWIIGKILRWWRTWLNIRYLRRCLRDSLKRGEAPFASHAIYTQHGVLDDTIPSERSHGIRAGFEWGHCADKRVFYLDRGWSSGMMAGRSEADRIGQTIEYRTIDREWVDVLLKKKEPRHKDEAPKITPLR